MRSMLRCLALLPLLLFVLAPPAHADPMDDFSIIGGGATIDFSLPASTTQACLTCIGSSNDQFNFGSVTGTVNNISQPIGLNFVIGSGCAECGTVLLSYPSTSWTIYLPDPTSLYGITYSGTFPNKDVTLTFIPGDYMTNGSTSHSILRNSKSRSHRKPPPPRNHPHSTFLLLPPHPCAACS